MALNPWTIGCELYGKSDEGGFIRGETATSDILFPEVVPFEAHKHLAAHIPGDRDITYIFGGSELFSWDIKWENLGDYNASLTATVNPNARGYFRNASGDYMHAYLCGRTT